MERPLFWYQGLFLQPQHLQLNDLSSQSLLIPYHRYLQPYFWGIGGMEIQETALGSFTFKLRKGTFFFPDMTYISFPGNAVIDPRSFDEAWIEGGKPFTVYLGLRRWSNSAANVTVVPSLDKLSEVTTRFAASAEPEEVQDLHSSGPAAPVKRLNHVLKLFWETEKDQLADYSIVPIAQLERSGNEIVLSERFIPPCLSYNVSGSLLKIITEIRDQLASRGRQLESYKQQKGIHTAEFGARELVYVLALMTINRSLPILFHMTEAVQVHPWDVFGTLRQIIGELSSFSERVNVMGELQDGTRLLPEYDHRNLWECFSAAQALIAQLLDEITAGPQYIFQLIYDGTYFAAQLPPTIFEARNRYYLVMKTDADPAALLQSLDTVAKLSSREGLPILIARALPGIKLKHLSIPPQELPRRGRSLYFQIDHHSDHWARVEKNNNIALYWDTAPEDLTIELMVV